MIVGNIVNTMIIIIKITIGIDRRVTVIFTVYP